MVDWEAGLGTFTRISHKFLLLTFVSLLFFPGCLSFTSRNSASNGTSSQSGSGGFPAVSLVLSGSPSETAGSCYNVSLTTLGSNGEPSAAVASGTVVTLSGATGVKFYSDPNCQTQIAGVDVSGNSASFYIMSSTPSTWTLTASASFASGSMTIQTQAGPPASLTLMGVPSFATFVCTPFTLSSVDVMGNVSTAISSIAANLTVASTSGVSLFSDSGCSVPTSSVSISSGMSSAMFYVLAETPSATNLSITATFAGLNSATYLFTTSQGTDPAIVLVPPASLTAGACAPVSLQLVANNAAFKAPANTVITISPNGSNLKYFAATDTTCSNTAITSVTVGAGMSSTSFFIQDKVAENNTMTSATATDFTSGNFSLSVGPAALAQLNLTATFSSTPADVCSQVNVSSKDSFGNPAPAAASLSIPITLSGSSAAQTLLYSDSGCSTKISSVQIPSGTTTNSFYFQTTQAGSVTLGLTPGTGITSNTLALAVTNAQGMPAHFALSTIPATIADGTCVPFQLFSQDPNGQPLIVEPSDLTISLISAGLMFYPDSSCSTPETSFVLAAGTSQQSFFVETSALGQISMNLASGSLAVSANMTATPGPAVGLALNLPTSITAEQCASASVTFTDKFGHMTSAASNVMASLAGSLINASGSVSFYSDQLCTNAISSITTLSTGNFYMSASASGTEKVSASASGLTSISGNVNVLPEAAYTLSLQAPASVQAGVCSNILVSIVDANGNTPDIIPEVVSLNASVGKIYSDPKCSVPVSSLTLDDTTGSNPQTIYIADTMLGSVKLSANTPDGLSSQVMVSIIPGPAAALTLSMTANPTASVCDNGFTVGVIDSFGNPITESSAFATTLTSSIIETTFSVGTGCSTPTQTIPIAAGASTNSFSILAPVPGKITITASASGLTSASLALTAGTPAGLGNGYGSGTTEAPQAPPAGNITGFFFISNLGGFFAANGDYCAVDTYNQWLAMGGPANTSTTPNYTAASSSMTFEGQCPVPVGFWFSGTTGYQSYNYNHYCSYDSYAQWLVNGGPSSGWPIYNIIPNTMVYDGQCLIKAGFWFSGTTGYYSAAATPSKYCSIDSPEQYTMMGGPANPPNYPTIPNDMTYIGQCQLTSGFFTTPNGVEYYANAIGQYCSIISEAEWLADGAPATGAPVYPTIPTSMTFGGECALLPGYWTVGTTTYFSSSATQTQYCSIDSSAQYTAMGGPATTPPAYPAIPNSMTYQGQCALPAGFYMFNSGLYFAKANLHICQFSTELAYLAAGGPTNTSSIPNYPTIPNVMISDGICQ